MWLIEPRLSNADGRGTAVVEGAPAPPEPDPDGEVTYDLQIDPADDWYPFRQVARTGFEAAGFAAADGAVRSAKGVWANPSRRFHLGASRPRAWA